MSKFTLNCEQHEFEVMHDTGVATLDTLLPLYNALLALAAGGFGIVRLGVRRLETHPTTWEYGFTDGSKRWTQEIRLVEGAAAAMISGEYDEWPDTIVSAHSNARLACQNLLLPLGIKTIKFKVL